MKNNQIKSNINKWFYKYFKDFNIICIAWYYHSKKEYSIGIDILSSRYDISSALYRDFTVRGLLSIEWYKRELWLSILFINFNLYFKKK